MATIVVDDYDRALGFYCGALGFRRVEDRRLTASKRWVVVEPSGGGARLLLARAASAAQRARIGDPTGGRVAFFLETEAFDRDHAALRAAGVRFEEAPRDEPYGRVAVFVDLYGVRWDLIERRA